MICLHEPAFRRMPSRFSIAVLPLLIATSPLGLQSEEIPQKKFLQHSEVIGAEKCIECHDSEVKAEALRQHGSAPERKSGRDRAKDGHHQSGPDPDERVVHPVSFHGAEAGQCSRQGDRRSQLRELPRRRQELARYSQYRGPPGIRRHSGGPGKTGFRCRGQGNAESRRHSSRRFELLQLPHRDR